MRSLTSCEREREKADRVIYFFFKTGRTGLKLYTKETRPGEMMHLSSLSCKTSQNIFFRRTGGMYILVSFF